jgi:hypothetical protein
MHAKVVSFLKEGDKNPCISWPLRVVVLLRKTKECFLKEKTRKRNVVSLTRETGKGKQKKGLLKSSIRLVVLRIQTKECFAQHAVCKGNKNIRFGGPYVVLARDTCPTLLKPSVWWPLRREGQEIIACKGHQIRAFIGTYPCSCLFF